MNCEIKRELERARECRAILLSEKRRLKFETECIKKNLDALNRHIATLDKVHNYKGECTE